MGGSIPKKRSRIHECLSLRAAVKTDAGTAAAPHTDGSKVLIAGDTSISTENGSQNSAKGWQLWQNGILYLEE